MRFREALLTCCTTPANGSDVKGVESWGLWAEENDRVEIDVSPRHRLFVGWNSAFPLEDRSTLQRQSKYLSSIVTHYS
ncbi:MAG: hypothetical protein J7641_15360 [Cyanobacteria bacterium SID2]|nr:hypothetical protein [Cyanobacteria bacterium SID2]MBP0004416.1 hypothetical protein [Cyanobacteria bacterium SBC]